MIKVIKKYVFSIVMLLLLFSSTLLVVPTYSKFFEKSPIVIVGQGYFGEIMQTQLYISNVSKDYVTCKGTALTYNASTTESITVTITNPTSDIYYYTDLTISATGPSATPNDGTLYVEVPYVEDGVNKVKQVYYVDAGMTITFTVSFSVAKQFDMFFNFTIIPPKAEQTGGMTNAPFIVEQVLNKVEHGLNKGDGKHCFEGWCNSKSPILYSTDNKVSGGQLGNLLAEINASGLYFALEYVNSNLYNLYIYPQLDSYTDGTNVIVYKQILYRETADSLWVPGASYTGYGKLESVKHAGTNYYHITTSNNKVLWTEGELPN